MNLDRVKAYLRLHLADGVGAVLSKRLREAFGSAEAVREAGPGAWRQVEGIGPKTAAAIAAVTDEQVEEELALAAKHGVTILCLEDPDYPAALKTIHDPPGVLYVRGRLEPADALAVAIVGARRCTHYGLEQAQRFGGLLGQAGFTVISGGARGIDAAAHRGALEAGGRTVAVMGCGLVATYPPENEKLFEQILLPAPVVPASSGGPANPNSGKQAGLFANAAAAKPAPATRGAIISELPMRTAVLHGNFPTRNRIISGLSLGVLIVEAARHSGSLLTAADAAEQGRCVMAVPGRVDSPTSQGTNHLIREGTTLVQDLDDVLQELGPAGGKIGALAAADSDAASAAAASAAAAALNPEERALAEALAEGPVSLDDLLRRTGLPTGKAASAMTMLTLKGVVAQRAGNVFELKRSRPAADSAK